MKRKASLEDYGLFLIEICLFSMSFITDKCAEVIHRLSSRVKNEQNQSTIVNNCNTMIPLCIEKS